MSIPTTSDLVDSLRRSRLLEPEHLQEVTIYLQTRFTESRGLAKELVQRGWLTPFQVNQLLQGKPDHLLLGPYVLLERLGGGAMGQVFKARQQRVGRIVALKVIDQQRLADPDAMRRFRREIEATARLEHPNAVFAYDADQAGDAYF